MKRTHRRHRHRRDARRRGPRRPGGDRLPGAPGRRLAAEGQRLRGSSSTPTRSFLYGVRAGVKVMTLAVELNYFQAAHNLFTATSLALPGWNDREVDYSYLGVNVRWTILPLPVIHPYPDRRLRVLHGGRPRTSTRTRRRVQRRGGRGAHAGKKLFAPRPRGSTTMSAWTSTPNGCKLGNFTLSGGLNIYLLRPARPMLVRLNKFLSQAGAASRREADRLIAEGRVRSTAGWSTSSGRRSTTRRTGSSSTAGRSGRTSASSTSS